MNLIHDGEDLKNGPFKLGELHAREVSRKVIQASDRQGRRGLGILAYDPTYITKMTDFSIMNRMSLLRNS